MTKIAESGSASGSGSISQRHGPADPDPDPDLHQYVMDPQHCWFLVNFTVCSAVGENMRSSCSACVQEGEETSGEGAPLHIQG
jgi:hypothetical protein